MGERGGLLRRGDGEVRRSQEGKLLTRQNSNPTHLCHLGLSGSVKSSTCRSSVARPAGPMPPWEARKRKQGCLSHRARNFLSLLTEFMTTQMRHLDQAKPTWITTMLPTAAAACAARGEGGSPCGVIFSHFPTRASNTCTSLVAPASRMPGGWGKL